MTTSPTVRRGAILTGLLLLIGLAGPVAAQTVWTGTQSSDWDDGGNWTLGVPNATTNADIPAGTPFDPIASGTPKSCRNLVLQPGATLTLDPGGALSVTRDATIDGTVTGSEPTIAAGSSSRTWTVGPGGAFGDVTANLAGSLTFAGTVTGDLTWMQGTLQPAPQSTVHVLGDATFSGGSVAGPFNGGMLDVDGNIVFAGATVTSPPPIRCGGDFTADAGFTPTSRIVTLDGSAPQALSAISLQSLAIAAGASVGTSDDLTVNQDLIVHGSFSTSALLDVNRDVIINGSLDFGAADQTFGRSLICPGTFNATGKFTFTGGGATVDVPAPLGTVDVALSSGAIKFDDDVTVSGDFTVLSGVVQPGPSSTLRVIGNALFSGGTIAGTFNAGVFDADGDLDFAGATVTSPPLIECAGNFTADAAFAPTSRTVVLDGTGPQTVSATSFDRLTIAAGASVTTSDDLVINDAFRVDGTFVALGLLSTSSAAPPIRPASTDRATRSRCSGRFAPAATSSRAWTGRAW